MKTLIFVFILVIASWQASAETCARRLELARPHADRTENLISYLSLLLEQRILGDNEVAKLTEGLQRGQLVNPLSSDQSSVSSKAQVHHSELQRYSEIPTINKAKLLAWVSEYTALRQTTRVARDTTRRTTINPFIKAAFHPIPTGSVEGVFGKLENNTPFEIMETLVTQKQWVDVMKINPASFSVGPNALTLSIDGKSISLQPDNPMENISWWSAVVFANKLSEKAGLTPVYDLSEVEFFPNTSAEQGNLARKSGDVKINAPDGNIYLAEGYRLPTENELDYVIRGAGVTESLPLFEDRIYLYSWGYENSGGVPHPVAELTPLVITGKPLFDLLGNVSVWCHDPPEHDWEGSVRAARGGSYARAPNEYGNWYNTYDQRDYIGFRLVRSLKK